MQTEDVLEKIGIITINNKHKVDSFFCSQKIKEMVMRDFSHFQQPALLKEIDRNKDVDKIIVFVELPNKHKRKNQKENKSQIYDIVVNYVSSNVMGGLEDKDEFMLQPVYEILRLK